MTEAEIIKALECCTTQSSCIGCPYDGADETCYKDMNLLKDALDLLNRQKAEIERLKAEADMADGYAEAVEERAKAKAIKEFAERLKNRILTIYKSTDGTCVYEINNGIIDNLVKEMVGESNV